jgi:hypothetical protein
MVVISGLWVPIPGAAQEKTDVRDPKGWRDARWGMTEEQILEAFRGQANRLAERMRTRGSALHTSVGIEHLDVDGTDMLVRFYVDNVDNRLELVKMEPADRNFCEAAPATFFERMEPLLVRKYGQPATRANPKREPWRATTGTAVWNFPSTILQLHYSDSDFLELKKQNSCEIRYEINRKKSTDNL